MLAVLKGDKWLAPTGKHTKKFANLIHLNPSKPNEIGYFDLKCQHLVLARAREDQVNQFSLILFLF